MAAWATKAMIQPVAHFSSIIFYSLFLVVPSFSFAAELPKATQAILKKHALPERILSGLDQELALPREWIDAARKEGNLRVLSTMDPNQAERFFLPFKERYPFLKLQYSRGSEETRIVRTLVALRSGKHVTDVLTGLSGAYFMYKEANALEDLRNIPTWNNNPPETKDSDGLWVGQDLRYWCMSYNTRKVKNEDLPKKWEDLVSNPFWRNGNLGIGNRPQLWVLMLWSTKGESWTRDFLMKLFNDVKPQRRKEGTNAILELNIAGEFLGAIPAATYRVKQKADAGAPVSLVCPEPIPLMVNEWVILKGAPNLNASRLMINWLLSKEGQISQFEAENAIPVHKDLRLKEFVPFPDKIVGKETAFRDPKIEVEIQPKLVKLWDELWAGRPGK
jgi:ABC-type Fe3+ transport system substrate-binding protein